MKVLMLDSWEEKHIVGAEFRRKNGRKAVQRARGDNSFKEFCCKGGEARERNREELLNGGLLCADGNDLLPVEQGRKAWSTRQREELLGLKFVDSIKQVGMLL